jgi:hypothetical protein
LGTTTYRLTALLVLTYLNSCRSQVRTDGVVSAAQVGSLGCESEMDAAVHVATDCLSVFVNGSETAAARNGGLLFWMNVNSERVFTTHLNISVWAPQTPLAVNAPLQTLNPIEGWSRHNPNTDQCEQVYQRVTLDVWANFSDGAGALVRTRVTSIVAPLLVSSNVSVASLLGRTVVGHSVGMATIAVQTSGGRTIGSVDVTVGDPARDNVSVVTALQVFVATALSMQPMTSPFAGGVNSDAVSITNQLELEVRVITLTSQLARTHPRECARTHALSTVTEMHTTFLFSSRKRMRSNTFAHAAQ